MPESSDTGMLHRRVETILASRPSRSLARPSSPHWASSRPCPARRSRRRVGRTSGPVTRRTWTPEPPLSSTPTRLARFLPGRAGSVHQCSHQVRCGRATRRALRRRCRRADDRPRSWARALLPRDGVELHGRIISRRALGRRAAPRPPHELRRAALNEAFTKDDQPDRPVVPPRGGELQTDTGIGNGCVSRSRIARASVSRRNGL